MIEGENMKIEILGTGCPKCEALKQNVEMAIQELGIDAEVLKVTDIVEIANRGVMMTPALSVDGEIKMVGKLATVAELKTLLSTI
jgi:small redox-active disulfide protein 2